MIEKMRVNYIIFITVFFSCFILNCIANAGDETSSVVTVAEDISIESVEDKLNRLKKSMNSLQYDTKCSDVSIKRDPFVSLIPDKKDGSNLKTTPKEEKIVRPDFSISGIIFNGRSSLAIIGDEVKQEGESIGEFEVYRIEKDRVFVRDGKNMFTLLFPSDETFMPVEKR
jgi:hypothetical protein